jgi:3-hydroxyacyl-[acyl-carrier-protein] dehydratase
MAIEGTFYFDPEDRIYEDHFPGRAVVPGSLIVQAFLEAGKAIGFSSAGGGTENFRFKEFVAPGAYAFSIEDMEKGLRCQLYHEGRTVAAGFLQPSVPPRATNIGGNVTRSW